MSPMVAAVLLIAYFMPSIQAYLATYALGTFQLSYWKLSPTELRLLLVAGNVALLFRPMDSLWGYRFSLFEPGGAPWDCRNVDHADRFEHTEYGRIVPGGAALNLLHLEREAHVNRFRRETGVTIACLVA